MLCIRYGHWPQRLHDVEEMEIVILQEHQQQQFARARGAGTKGMTDPQIGLSMLLLFIVMIMLGFPIAFTLMGMGVSFGFYAYYVPGEDLFLNSPCSCRNASIHLACAS